MTNFEKYKDEIERILSDGCHVGMSNNKLAPCPNISCKSCMFLSDTVWCEGNFFKWGMQEYIEPKRLTKEEHCFCVAAKSGCIARDKESLCYFDSESSIELTECYGWDFVDDGEFINIGECMPHLKFSSIGMNEKYNIEELLQMEVSDNE